MDSIGETTLGILESGVYATSVRGSFLAEAAMNASAKSRISSRGSVATAIHAVARRALARLVSLAGLAAAISGLVLALLSVHEVATAMTWGMLALFGLSLPVLCVLHAMDTRRDVGPDETTAGNLTDHTTHLG